MAKAPIKWKRLFKFKAFQKVVFYAFNFIMFSFLYRAFIRESILELFSIGGAILAIVGALSGLCYSAAPSVNGTQSKRILVESGHRFLHCFLYIVFAITFSSALIILKTENVFSFQSYILLVPSIILILLTVNSYLVAGRSFTVGYHMLREILDSRFPFKDERLFDDIEKSEL
jgi:hypothetical protein